MTKSNADLEKENAEFRARVELQDKLLARLLAEPPRVEVRTVEKLVPAPWTPCPLPHFPPASPTVNPNLPQWPWTHDRTITANEKLVGYGVITSDFQGWHPSTGCAANPCAQQITISDNSQWSGSGTYLGNPSVNGLS
jgi:hypothetical protein